MAYITEQSNIIVFLKQTQHILTSCSWLSLAYFNLKFVAGFASQALELVPTEIHQRSPIFLGSYNDVEEIKSLYASESSTDLSA